MHTRKNAWTHPCRQHADTAHVHAQPAGHPHTTCNSHAQRLRRARVLHMRHAAAAPKRHKRACSKSRPSAFDRRCSMSSIFTFSEGSGGGAGTTLTRTLGWSAAAAPWCSERWRNAACTRLLHHTASYPSATVLQTQTKQTVLPGCPPSCARLPSCSGLAWYAVHEFLAPLPRSLLATLVVPSSHACPRGHDMSHPSPPLHTCDASNPSTAGRPRILRSEARVWGGPISWSPRGRTKRWPSGTVP